MQVRSPNYTTIMSKTIPGCCEELLLASCKVCGEKSLFRRDQMIQSNVIIGEDLFWK